MVKYRFVRYTHTFRFVRCSYHHFLSPRRLEDVFRTSLRHVFKTSWRPTNVCCAFSERSLRCLFQWRSDWDFSDISLSVGKLLRIIRRSVNLLNTVTIMRLRKNCITLKKDLLLPWNYLKNFGKLPDNAHMIKAIFFSRKPETYCVGFTTDVSHFTTPSSRYRFQN